MLCTRTVPVRLSLFLVLIESIFLVPELQVRTDPADNVVNDGAVLHGKLLSCGAELPAAVSFQWGTASGNLFN
jgi:hypothetical protein